MAEPRDFSSFDPQVEATFVPFERTMKENEKRAGTLGLGIAAGVLVIAAITVGFLYSPCSGFCSRPPGSCKSERDIAAWKANCESACSALEHTSGLSFNREVKDEKTGEVRSYAEPATGAQFVTQLSSCAFSGGSGATCEGVVKVATEKGLWCAEKN